MTKLKIKELPWRDGNKVAQADIGDYCFHIEVFNDKWYRYRMWYETKLLVEQKCTTMKHAEEKCQQLFEEEVFTSYEEYLDLVEDS